jgi:Domain of unknown function (DUF932)
MGAGAAARVRRARRRPVSDHVYVANVANSHDGSMAVTGGHPNPDRMRRHPWSGTAAGRHGVHAQRTFRFRHTGNLQAKFAEARRVLGMTINYQKQFKKLADRMAIERIAEWTLERRVLRHLWTIDADMGKVARVARAKRARTIEDVLAVFRGRSAARDTTGNSPGTKWTAFNAIAEHLDYGRRYASRTNQIQRSFEDATLKQRALELVVAA